MNMYEKTRKTKDSLRKKFTKAVLIIIVTKQKRVILLISLRFLVRLFRIGKPNMQTTENIKIMKLNVSFSRNNSPIMLLLYANIIDCSV